MNKLRILKVSFDTSIQPYQLPAFRAAIAHKVGLEHDWFHNHDNINGQFHYRYPLIQYKLDTFKGQMCPMLFCLNHAIEEAQHLFGQSDWSIQIGTDFHNLSVSNLDACQHSLNVSSDTFFKYRLHKWQALNPNNYNIWKSVTSEIEAIFFLEQKLANHICSFTSAMSYKPTTRFQVRQLNILKKEWVFFKNVKILAFTVDFETNISLPQWIGLGKGCSQGLGVVKKLK